MTTKESLTTLTPDGSGGFERRPELAKVDDVAGATAAKVTGGRVQADQAVGHAVSPGKHFSA